MEYNSRPLAGPPRERDPGLRMREITVVAIGCAIGFALVLLSFFIVRVHHVWWLGETDWSGRSNELPVELDAGYKQCEEEAKAVYQRSAS